MLGNCTKLMLGLLLAALWTIRPAQADTATCVNSPAALTFALAGAETASGTTTIELVQGTYDVSSTPLVSSNPRYNSLQLLGGYTDNTCTSRVVDGENTVIDGGGAGSMAIQMNANTNLLVEGLRFQGFTATNSQQIFIDVIGGGTFRFNHFYKTGMQLNGDFISGNVLGVYNNLVDESPAGQDGLVINANTNDFVTITGNTIGYAGNRNLYLCMNPGGINNANAIFANNIIWGHFGSGGGFDIRIGCDSDFPRAAYFDDNTYGSMSGSEASGSSGTLLSDPLYIGGGNYRLQTPLNSANTSPSVNSGDNGAAGNTGTDLDGNPRIVGSAVDRGAYESAYDNTASTTFVVTSTDDTDGNTCGTICTLRQAINAANAVNVFHYINFALQNQGANCTNVITLSSKLPVIKYSMRIDGFSQPGARANTYATGDNAHRCVVLNGNSSTSVLTGLIYAGSANSQFWVQGLVFEGFNDGTGGSAALTLLSGNGDLIWGNQFGGYYANTQLLKNYTNIEIDGNNTHASIGGSNRFQRNIIADASTGVSIPTGGFFGDSTGNSIVGNLIGTDGTETKNSNNIYNIKIETNSNTVSGNVIVYGIAGIYLRGGNATGNYIHDNLIGITDSACGLIICLGGLNAGNQIGILFSAATGAASGNTVSSNTIWYNSPGIEMLNGGEQRNNIQGNSIYANTIPPTGYAYPYAGINFGYAASTTYNDADPGVQNMPNHGLNVPIITSASGGTSSGVITGTLASTNGAYFIDAYSSQRCDASGYGQGETFNGDFFRLISNAPSGNNGSVSFSLPFNVEAGGNLAGRVITLTATDSIGNTSQFSACHAYQCDVIFRHGFDSAAGEKCP